MKRLKLFFACLLMAVLSIGQMWGAVVSGTTYGTPSISSLPTSWSGSDGSGTSYVKLTASTHYIQTDEFCASSFSSIKVKARKFGGPSDAQALITVSWWVGNTETVLGTVAPSNTTLTDYTISSPTSITEAEGYIKISCKGAGSSKGSGVSEVTITYTTGSCGSGGGDEPGGGENPGGGEDPIEDNLTLTFNVSSNPGGWPTANDANLTNYIYSLNNVDYTFALKNAKCNSGYLMLTQPAVLGLPARSGYKLVKVEANNSGGCSTSTKVKITSDEAGQNDVSGGAQQTWSTQSSTYTYSLAGTSENTMYYLIVSNKNCQLTGLVLYYEEADAPEVAQPTISGENNFLSTTTVTLTQAAADYIYYTTDGTAPTTSSTKYTAPFSLEATTTVKAIAVKGGVSSEQAEKTFTKATLMSVAEALALTAPLPSNVYVEGVICSATEGNSGISTQYGNATYNISDDGTGVGMIVYRGKYLGNVAISNANKGKFAVGNKVIVYGNMGTHNNANQLAENNYIVNLVEKEANPQSIAISGTMNVTEYALNATTLDYSGLTVKALYNTGYHPEVASSDIEWSFTPALNETGSKNITITATVGSLSDTKEVTVTVADKELQSIAIQENPYAPEAYCGAEMPKPTVIATFDNGTEDVTSACSFTPVDMLVPGVHTITVSYTYGEVERTAEYQLKVNAYSVAEAQSVIPAEGNIETSVEGVIRWIDYVNTAANQGYAKYSISAVGSKDDADTLLIYNSYADKSGEEYVKFTESNAIELGDKVVVSGSFCTYGSNNLKETVTKQSYISSLTKKAVSSLAISGELTNTEYQQGATVDPAGLTVTATYNTGYTADVTANVEWSSDPMTTVGDAVAVALTASYGGKNANGEYSVKVIAPKQDAGLEYATAEYNANINAEFATPELTNPNNLTVTYSSNDENLAVVDENTGEVLIGENEGIVTITATFAGNAGYNAGYASYTITISDPTLTKVTFDATVDIENFTKNYITMSCTNGALDNGSEYRLYKSSTTTFECSNGDIKKIEFIGVSGNPASNFAAPEIGTFVTSGYNGTWTGSASSVAFTASANQVRVTKIIVSYKEDTRAAAGLEYAVAEYNAATNAEFETPQLTNPNNLTVTYSSSDENLAVVDENTGEVLIGANEGTVTITATFAGNETYKSGSASYTITISVPDLRYKAEKTSFDAISGKVATVTEGTHKDKEYISYAAFKGDGTTDPNADNNILTFYKPSSGKTTGGYVMISAVKGCTINEVQVTNAGSKATTIGCSTTSTLATTGEAYAKNATVSFKNLNSAVVYIDDIGTERVDIAKLVVYYIGEPAAIDHYVLDGTYETSFEQNTTFNHEGLIVYACYDELEMDKVDITSECTFSMPDMNVVGDQTIEITYNSTVVKSYTITVTPGKALPNLTYSPASVEITSGDIWSAPILGYAEGFDGVDAISYNSNKTSIATVSNEGVIALAGGFGTAVITASFEGNENYVAGSATYTITVNEPSDDLSGKWVVASSVAIGDRIIIANEAAAGVVKTMGKQNGNNRAVVLSSVDAQGVLTPAKGTKVFTLIDAGDGKFALKALNGSYLYAAGGTSSNYLKETDTYAAPSAKWGIAISNSKATIQATSAGRNWMRYNSSSDLFSCYASGQNDIVVYKIEEVAPAADAIAPIGGKFIINADRDTVVFSRGNLQYNYGTAQWSCAAHQYDVLADANLNFGKEGYDGPIDLFGWSNSVSNFGRLTSNKDADYPGVGDFIDWGVKFPGETKWTTMSKDEWEYLQAKNNWTMINLIDAEAVNEYDVFYAMVLFPENWVAPAGLENLNYKFYNFDDEPKAEQNTITVAQWNSLFEPNGAVLLPAAGSRAGYWGNMIGKDGVSTATTGLLPNGQNYDHVDNVGWYGYYWLTTQDTREDYKHCASYLILPAWSEGPTLADEDDEYRAPAVWSREKRRGNSVRLVHVIPSVKHTLSYNAGGATGDVPASVENNYIGKELTVAALGNLEKAGCEFQGWYYNGQLYQAGDKFAMPAENATLKAMWRKVAVVETTEETPGEKVTTVLADANISDLGYVEDETIIVKSGTTLVGDEPSAPKGIVVEQGARYEAEAETTTPTVTFSVTMGNSQQDGSASEIGTPANIILTTGGEITYDITLGTSLAGVQADPNQWHAFTVPFPCDALNGIYNAETGEKLANEVDYAIMDYHGDIRANGQYGWKKYRGILQPGTFYIVTIEDGISTLRFKLNTSGNLPTATGMAYAENSGTGAEGDQGWNGIGNPTWEGVTLPYDVQILDPYSYEYVTVTAGTNIPVSTPVFYKASADGMMDMTPTAEANQSAPAPKRLETNEIRKMAVSFGNEVFADKLYVTASEDALNSYEQDKDLVKMRMSNTPKVAQIFGDAYGMKLSMVNTPLVNDNAEVALTLYAPAAGEYTISIAKTTNATVYLVRDGRIIWNLSESDYTTTFEKGDNTNYGLRLVAAPQVPTDIENVQGDHAQCTKVIIDEHVYILRGEKMYDVTGKMLR